MVRKFFLSVFLLLAALVGRAQAHLELPFIEDDEIIVRHHGFTLSYDPGEMLSRWVAYELRDTDMDGDAQRLGSFYPDPSPELAGLPLAEHWYYTHSGWVRGHMVPAGDLRYSQEAMNDSFCTTNVCPMHLQFNNGVWKRLEEKVRKWALRYGRVYIISGPVVGSGKYGKVGDSGITVPDAFFKAVLIPVEDSWLSIGFLLPNEPSSKGFRLRDCAATVDGLERLTGMDFFWGLDEKEAASVERQLPLRELEL